MKKRRLSHLSLLKELRKILIRPDTTITLRKFNDLHGHSAWDWDYTENKSILARNVRIHIDPRRDSRVSVVVHELLHVYLQEIVSKFTDQIEEAIVLGLEKELYRYLSRPQNEKLLESWHKAIERKLSC